MRDHDMQRSSETQTLNFFVVAAWVSLPGCHYPTHYPTEQDDHHLTRFTFVQCAKVVHSCKLCTLVSILYYYLNTII